jgi:endoglucanase
VIVQAASNASTGTVILPGTGDWHTWRNVEDIGTLRLNKGLATMTLSILKNGEINIDDLEFVPVVEGASAFTPIDPFEQVKQMQRGVNVLGYDPIWKDFSQRRFQEGYFQKLHEAGFQSIRVNLQAFRHMDALNRLSPDWFKTLDWVIDHALANQLTVVLDEHDYEPCAKDYGYCSDKLLSFWEQVAARYKDTSNRVLFEILNEPNTAITNQNWNGLLKEMLSVIRRTNPKRNVIIGPALWNGFTNLKTLELPADDRNIIVTVHYYRPSQFTHQGAYWSKATMGLSGIQWGTDAEKQTVNQDFAGVQEWARANNRPVYLGEFGSYDKGDMNSRVQYTSFIARTAESLGWAWAYWQFDADFVVYNIEKDQWVEPLRKALLP